MAHTKEYLKAYRQTEKYKSYRRKYDTSGKYKEWRKKYRKKIGNSGSKRYEKTLNGFLMRLYRNMYSRVYGIQRQKWHLYKGIDILPKEDFYEWSKKSHALKRLFRAWENSSYDRKFTPSVNRINPKRGYTIDNMEWLTHSENSRLTSRNKKI